jgi:hypothetical protein
MPYTTEQLDKIADSYAEVAEKALVIEAKKKGKFPFWLKKKETKSEDKDSNNAKDKKKLDPKAKVRNKPNPVVPAERAKDKKDHFPLSNINQARNALARVKQFDKAPPWWKGSLKSLQDAVARKVKSKYPSIDVGGKKKDKKSSLEVSDSLFQKYAR